MKKKEIYCLFCSSSHKLNVVVERDFVKYISYCEENGICPRGNCIMELLNHRDRLTTYYINEASKRIEVGEKEFYSKLEEYLNEKLDAEKTGILISSYISNEDALAIKQFAENFKIDKIFINENYEDYAAAAGLAESKKFQIASLKDIEESDLIVCIGDAFSVSPALARTVLASRYADRNRNLIVIDAYKNRTANFATRFVKVKPGLTKTVGLLIGLNLLKDKEFKKKIETILKKKEIASYKNEIDEITEAFNKGKKVSVLIATTLMRGDGSAACMQAFARVSEKIDKVKIYPVFMGANLYSIKKLIPQLLPYEELEGYISEKKISNIMVFGTVPQIIRTDLLSEIEISLLHTEFLVEEIFEKAKFLAPMSMWPEENCTLEIPHLGVIKQKAAIMPPGAALSIKSLVEKIGVKFKKSRKGKETKAYDYISQWLNSCTNFLNNLETQEGLKFIGISDPGLPHCPGILYYASYVKALINAPYVVAREGDKFKGASFVNLEVENNKLGCKLEKLKGMEENIIGIPHGFVELNFIRKYMKDAENTGAVVPERNLKVTT